MSIYKANKEITGVYVGSTQISNAYIGSSQIYGGSVSVDGLRFTAKQANSTVGLSKKSSYQTLEYSYDGVDWSGLTTSTTITLTNSGDSVYVRGTLSADNTADNYTMFSLGGDIKLKGNVNTLWDYQNPNTPLKVRCGMNLFSGCTALTDITEITLPSTTLSDRCYQKMFASTRITTISGNLLPATTLDMACYHSMFQYCHQLTSVAPNLLPATTLSSSGYCYSYMFENCPFTTAPNLPASVVTTYSYYRMFKGCSNLNYVKCLATDITATNTTTEWLANVSSSGTFVKSASMSNWGTGNNGIPNNWSVEDA